MICTTFSKEMPVDFLIAWVRDMANLVLGLGTSHTPLLTLPSKEWSHRANADYGNSQLNLSDGRSVNYEELLLEVGGRYENDITLDILERKALACQRALDRMADEIEAVSPDVVVIVGDDQRELFSAANQPAISVFYGEEVKTSDTFGREGLPQWQRKVGEAYLMERAHTLRGSPELGLDVIQGLLDRGIDIATSQYVVSADGAGFGHAFGFVVKRLFRGRNIPILPLLINTYYPPNVPSPARCYEIGRALRAALERSAFSIRVAIIASGGLSHFVVDEALDRSVLDAIRRTDVAALKAIPRDALNSGSSEILNWVLTAGALEGIPLTWCEYQPLYRTPAGTGIGAAFAAWRV